MPIRIHNTLTRRKEEFKPITEGKVGIYHCGPTVYWTQHIGNLRGMFFGDVVTRTLKYLGYEVDYVRNYTDVGHLTSDEDEGEDKMEKGAKREGLSPLEIAQKYIDIFERDTALINISDPTVKPRATEHIDGMIEMIKNLIDKGFAYQTDLAVYFDTSKFENYTKLSKQKLDDNIAGAGKGDTSDPGKKHPADFALWFFKAGKHANALQFWPSPFTSSLAQNGEGFPGWHIECSAMSKKYLGDTIDIHMGGIEHVSVHHTNEIAQSECANDAKFVNYWMHNEHLLVNDRKMSKSEGTGFSVSEIIDRGYKPLALRYFFLQAHYRSRQNFTWEALEAAQKGLENLYSHIARIKVQMDSSRGLQPGAVEGFSPIARADDAVYQKKYIQDFKVALSDDFNTPQALAVMQEMLKSDLSAEDKLTIIKEYDKVLSLDLLKNADENKNAQLPDNIQQLVDERVSARKEKNWAESDRLRDKIESEGYEVEDSKDRMRVWRK